jgi:glycosyltransferase involved in cell wall biosynthesis
MNLDDVGVVVIGRNEGDRLIRCLKSVKTWVPDIVYVDSGSEDRSVEAAADIGACVVSLDLTTPFTAARARNKGYLALKSRKPAVRFVQFIDGDCSLAPGWLETARAFIGNRNDLAIVCGRRRERYPDASIYNYFCDMEWDTPIGEALACGGDALVRVEAFDAVRGFRSGLIAGEEPELCFRLRKQGWKIWRLDAEMTEHDAAMKRFQQWWIRTVRGGYAAAEVWWLHRNSQSAIWRWETLRACIWGGFLPAAIALGALFHPILLISVSVYLLQVCQIAFRVGPGSHRSWLQALMLTLGKFAEFQGFLTFIWRKRQSSASRLIEYK